MSRLGQTEFNWKRAVTWMFLFSLVSFALCVGIFSCSASAGYTSSVDLSTVELVQLDAPQEGDPIAVIRTDLGDLSVRLYPEYAPQAVKNFTALAESGYYDGTYVFQIASDVYFAAGSPNQDGSLAEDHDEAAEKIPQELHQNLWPLKGALCAMTTASEGGFWDTLTGKVQYYNGSRFLMVNSIAFTDEIKEGMLESGEDNPVTDAFFTHGGIPNYSQQLTIFGQTYEGLEVLEAITSAALNGEGDELPPAEDIRIQTIEIGSYSEKSTESPTS